MRMKKTLTLTLVALFLISTVSLHLTVVKAQTRMLIVPDQYPTIQAAIDNASAGDTVFVRSGIYNQSVTIDKPINLVGQNAKTTTLTMPKIYNDRNPAPPATYVINAKADNVIISNFTLANPNPSGTAINSYGNGNQITSVTISPISINELGIYISGSNQNVYQSKITGIQCYGSYNQIINNNFSDGISLTGSNNNLFGNSFSNPSVISLSNANNNVIQGNILNQGGIGLLDSNSNTICNNTMGGTLGLGNPGPSIGPASASDNLIAGNTIEGDRHLGIGMGYGSNNVFYGNLIANISGLGGLGLGASGVEVDNNVFYCNVFMNNSQNFVTYWQVIGSNSFDNGSMGNYWDDYLTKYPNATEVDNSGVGNIPYVVYSNVSDNYPLMAPFDISSVNVQLPAWMNSLPTLVPVPSFPQLNPTSSPSPSPTVPELSWLVVVSLLFGLFSVAMVVRHKKAKL